METAKKVSIAKSVKKLSQKEIETLRNMVKTGEASFSERVPMAYHR